jgi:hypothetical protein
LLHYQQLPAFTCRIYGYDADERVFITQKYESMKFVHQNVQNRSNHGKSIEISSSYLISSHKDASRFIFVFVATSIHQLQS